MNNGGKKLVWWVLLKGIRKLQIERKFEYGRQKVSVKVR